MKKYIPLLVAIGLILQGYHAQVTPSKFENIAYLLTFGQGSTPSWGDDDHVQIHFFVVPQTENRPVYIRVYDPSTGGELDTPNGVFDTRTVYTIYGGKGAYSTKEARSINPQKNYDKGVIIDRKVFSNEAKYDQQWYSFGPINPKEGEYSKEMKGYVFKVICKGLNGNDGNAYEYALSYKSDANIPIEGGNAFTYEMCFRLKPGVKETAHVYPFINKKVVSIEQHNFDADNDVDMRLTSVTKKLHYVKESGNGGWMKSLHKIDEGEKNTSIDFQLIKKTEDYNDMVIFFLNQYEEAVPFFSTPIGGVPKYKYKIDVNYKFD
ncbi:MAG: hypothetical protein N4A35_09425 [Flavobacteriales bacterium]|jgi:hypothetical protein|nr:hypothetical protein [Flavobacteriales bacterium]